MVLKYTKEHEWIKLDEGSDIALIGISNYAQEQLGDVVSLEFPQKGDTFKQNDSMAIVDSMKTSSDVYAPVSGEVTEINTELENAPQLVNEDPLGRGWLIKIKVGNKAEMDNLMTEEEYEKFITENESH